MVEDFRDVKAERDRLREALERIVAFPVTADTDPAHAFAEVRRIAREAAGPEGEPDAV